ncbi:MAG: hypothetical protein H8D43_00470, partial [Chloroflexi bacterium]|nr:hypothetical protein [Chloroflexota bacterium]
MYSDRNYVFFAGTAMTQNHIALLTAFAYVFAMIGVAEALRKWRGYSVEFTR